MFVAGDVGKKQDHPRDVSVPSEQAVPKTPGEKILAVLLLIQDQATAKDVYKRQLWGRPVFHACGSACRA